jgi:hypothetical protein
VPTTPTRRAADAPPTRPCTLHTAYDMPPSRRSAGGR